MALLKNPRLSLSVYVEQLLGFLAVGWGAWVIMFRGASTLVTYAAMAEFVPRWLIGAIFILLGLLVLFLPGPHRRRFVHAALLVGWFLVSLSFFFFDLPNTGGVIYLIVACMSAGVYLRLSQISSHR